MLNAVRIATDEVAQNKGAMLAMNNQINAARYVTKTHTANVESFKSGDYGVLGEVDPDRVVIDRTPTRRQHIPLVTDEMPRVDIVAMYGGADGQLLRYAVDSAAKGIVVQAFGMGNMNLPMFEAVQYALSKDVPVVVISTRVHNGRVMANYGFEGGGQTTDAAGAIMGGDLSPQKARILLMLLLQQGKKNKDELQPAFDL